MQSTSKRIAIIVAIIGALGTIIGAIIAIYPSLKNPSLQGEAGKIVYSVELREEGTNNPIPQVVVTLIVDELVPPVQYSNSQGLVRFELPKNKEKSEGRVNVSKNNYKSDDRIVLIANGKIEQFILKPLY